jgi:hypothetical protein
MRPDDARYVHSALAHALLEVWPICPRAQQIIQAEIEDWSLRDTAADRDQYMQNVIQRLRSGGVEEHVLAALDNAHDELPRVDGYLAAMFNDTLALVRKSYETWADWAVSDVRLAKVAVTNPKYPDRANFGELGVVACVPPREAADPAIVKLTFVPSFLGPPSWASVPYLLCHELICHVNQAAPMDSVDSFAEGWMDFVAWRLHDLWADTIFPWAPELAREAAGRLSDVVLQRWRGLPEPHLTTRAMRANGRRAAKFVESKLRPFDDGNQPIPPLARLSLLLNRVSPTVTGRMAFVSRINNAQRDWGLEARLLADLRRWLDGNTPPPGVLSFE